MSDRRKTALRSYDIRSRDLICYLLFGIIIAPFQAGCSRTAIALGLRNSSVKGESHRILNYTYPHLGEWYVAFMVSSTTMLFSTVDR
jgi:hypothetical protein